LAFTGEWLSSGIHHPADRHNDDWTEATGGTRHLLDEHGLAGIDRWPRRQSCSRSPAPCCRTNTYASGSAGGPSSRPPPANSLPCATGMGAAASSYPPTPRRIFEAGHGFAQMSRII
jgi:hypothetical protein